MLPIHKAKLQSAFLLDTFPFALLNSVASLSYSRAFCSACFFTMAAGISVKGRQRGAARLTVVADFLFTSGELLLEFLDLFGLVLGSDLPLRRLSAL